MLSPVSSTMSIRSWTLRFIIVLFGGFISGCDCVEDGASVSLLEFKPGQSLASVMDSHLARVYHQAPFLDDREYAIRWFPNSIEITTFRGLNIPEINNTMALYKDKDSSRDTIAKAYVKAAKSRGHEVKLYDASANQAIVGCVKQRLSSRTYIRADIDPTLIEYDAKGKMVSALVRIHRLDRNMVTQSHFVVSKIYLGSLAKSIEAQLGGQKGLNDQFIGTI